MREIIEVPIAEIKIGKRLRPLGDLSGLVESIRTIGLLNPIQLSQDLTLIAGLHRLEACKKLGYSKIPAFILEATELARNLAEIDENLVRTELSLLERAEHLYRRKQIYESLYPETRKGGDRGNQYVGSKPRHNDKLTFSQDVATRLRFSPRTVQRLVRIAENLSSEVKELVRDSGLAENQQQLLKLCELAPELQLSVAEMIAGSPGISVEPDEG